MARKPLLTLDIGDKFDDYQCVGISTGNNNTTRYIMKCSICGREKAMLSSTLRAHKGTTHAACGKGIKTSDRTFYMRWQAMRTRTTNPKQDHSASYIKKGIKSDEFALFIDFYDAMYDSYKTLADKIGVKNVSLERIDIDKDYSVDNCIWIDKHDQPKNNRRIIYFEVTFPDGHSERHRNVRDFARRHNLNPSVIMDCLNPDRTTQHHRGFSFKRLKCND